MLVGVPHKDAVLKTHPVNFLNERTLKGTFFGNYKPRSDLPSVVERYMNKVGALVAEASLFLAITLMVMDCLYCAGDRVGEVHHA